MNKELKLLIQIVKSNKVEFTADELAAFLGLKFREGVYPHLRKLQALGCISRKAKGTYLLNEVNPKVSVVRFLKELFGADADLLFTIHAKKVLQKFSTNPILKTMDLPYHNLRTIRDIAKKTKIIHSMREGKGETWFIRSWEEPTKKLLEFFGIKLQYDEEEYRHQILKSYSAFTGGQAHMKDEKTARLAELNLKSYLEGGDFVLGKLKNLDFSEFAVIDILTKNKKAAFNNNPFEITRRINDWKIKYVYNTDRIEGNPLTMEEVRTILTVGAEAVKKEKKDILETVNSKIALENIFDTANELGAEFVKKLHLITQQGIDTSAGEYKQEENCIVDGAGNLIDTTTPAKFTGERMDSLIRWYYENRGKLHPLALASVVHNQFVYVHPFGDGNGRVARLLFNFVLVKHGYFPIIFHNDQKHRYYSALRQSKDGDMKIFILYSLDLYREQLEAF